jgi:hypothetical protein
MNRGNANRFGHIFRRNCLLKHVIEEKIEGRIEGAGSRGRQRMQLLDSLKEKTEYKTFKWQALDRTVCRTRFGRVYGPVVRRTAECTKCIKLVLKMAKRKNLLFQVAG